MKIKKIIILIMSFFLLNGNIRANTIDAEKLSKLADKKRNALIETAEAYYRKGKSVQYDVYRENRFNSPEQATSQHTIYSVCSSFMQQVYNNTLNSISVSYPSTNLIKYAKNYYTSSSNYYDSSITTDDLASGKYILKYYDKESTKKALNDVDLSTEWSKFLKKGDVFVVNYESLGMGHTMIVKDVVGTTVTLIDNNGKVYIHDENSKKYVESYESNGSINIISLNDRLESYRGSAVSEMALIRYITDDNKYLGTSGTELNVYPLSSAAELRLLYPSIDIEKTSRVISEKNNNSSVLTANLNDKIEYTITIKNNSSNDYKNLIVTENIDNQVVKLISYDGTPNIENSQIIWNDINVSKGQVHKIKYTVQVNSNENLLGEVIDSTGNVGNGTYFIDNTNVYHYISNTLRSDQKEALSAYTNDLGLYKNVSGRNFINELYLNILNVDLGLDNLTNNQIISYCDSECKNNLGANLVVANTRINDTSVSNMILYNFYGLATVPNEDNYTANQTVNAFEAWRYLENKENLNDIRNRARTITIDMLEIGDIILLYDASTSKEMDYIYINEDEIIRKINENEFETLKGKQIDEFLKNIIGNNYIVLRPALIMENNKINNDNGNNEDINNGNDETNDSNDNLDDKNENNQNNNIYNPETGDYIVVYVVLGTILIIVCILIIKKIKGIKTK